MTDKIDGGAKTMALRTAVAMAAGVALGGGQIIAMDFGREPAKSYRGPSDGDLMRLSAAEVKRARKAAKRLALLAERGKQ